VKRASRSHPRGPGGNGSRDLRRGRAAYASRAWEEAHAALSAADRAAPLGAPDLERLAWAGALTGRGEDLVRLLERLFEAHVEAGQHAAAARTAFWLSMRFFAYGEPGRANGWLARSRRRVACEGRTCVEEGYLLLPLAQRRLAAGEWEAAHEAAASAAEIGARFEDLDLMAFARSMQGRALMLRGRLDEGLALMDEAMVATTKGELSPMITGLIYCSAIAVCHQVYVLDRAREWTAALAGWCEAQPQLAMFTGACFVHRAQVQQLAGAWPEAIVEARRVFDRATRTTDATAAGEAHYQQGEIHRLRGDLATAEMAYRSGSGLGREPQPGLALLRLAEGRPEAAVRAIHGALGRTTGALQRAQLLPAAVEIFVSAGRVEQARCACEELAAVAADVGAEFLGALVAQARGTVLLASGEAAEALTWLRRAFRVFQRFDAPYLAARVRVQSATACSALGDEDAAGLELEAARPVFERLEAARDLAHVDALRAPRTSAARPRGLTPRELEVLRLVAAGQTNRSIAQRLFLSEKTVDRHVSNILNKVDARSRAAATAFAYEQKLM
jgi:DNA-binding CsgD family transcriptional regulator